MLNINANINPLRPANNICLPTLNLLQFNKFIESGLWKDEIGDHDGTPNEGGIYVFNGVDQYINTKTKVQGQAPIDITTQINISTVKYTGFWSCMNQATGNGMYIKLDELVWGRVQIYVSGGANISTSIILSANVDYVVRTQWSGISGEGITITVNGIEYIYTALSDWTGDSAGDLLFGTYHTNSRNIEGSIPYYSYTINNQPKVESYCEQVTLFDDGTDTNVLLTKTIGVKNYLEGAITGFFDTSQEVESHANQVGWGVIDAQAGVIVPLDSVTNEPVIPCDTVYKGRVKYNLEATAWACNFNITDNQISLGSTGITVIDYISEAGTTPIIDGQYLKVDVAGWLGFVELSNGVRFEFVQGGGNTVADVNSDTSYLIAGATPTWIRQSKYFYVWLNGGTKGGSEWIPASQLNIGKDTDGGDLTNPAIYDGTKLIGNNGGALIQQQANNKELVDADTDNVWFEADGTRKKLSLAELPSNTGDYDYNNVFSPQYVRSHLLYGAAQSVENQEKIVECQAKALDGVTAQFNYGSIAQFNNGVIAEFN